MTDTVSQKSEHSFNPEQRLSKLSRRQKTADGQWNTVELDYMEVKWRLVWLRDEWPAARINTDLVKLDLDRQLAIFKATVTLPDGQGEATGWGSETADDWRDFIEKAETKALGRALAALGYGTQFCADELDAPIVDSPVDRGPKAPVAADPRTSSLGQRHPGAARPATAPAASRSSAGGSGGSWTDRPATEPQIKAIYAIARGAQAMDDATLEEFIRSRYGCLPAELNRRQASEAIDALKLGAAS